MTLSKTNILATIAGHRDALRRLRVKRIGLFGSVARGDNRPDSDLDFLVEFSEKSFDGYMELKFYLESLFHRPVDLVLPTTLKPRLRDKVLAEVVYAQGL